MLPTSAPSPPDPFDAGSAGPSPAARKALAGFFLVGLLMSFLGAVLPAWGYHLRTEFIEVGEYFLCLNIGLLLSATLGQKLLTWKGMTFTLAIACAVASAGLFELAAFGPPALPWWRMAGVGVIGLGVGTLNVALFHAISPAYRHEPAATVNLAGMLFGLGCLLTALLVAGTFYVYTVGSILILLALIPAFYAGLYARARLPTPPLSSQQPLRQAVEDFRSPAAILFTLLLFFQFGNEWAIAGWLPLFLVQRVGVSPETSLFLLALYWLALLIGRIAAQAILPRMTRGRVLLGSVAGALLGCLILTFTNNVSGAVAGVLMVGFGFSVIYPLVVEKIGHRFPYYHPGFFNGLFSLAVTGGMLAPWTLGYLAEAWGIQAVMLLPLAGTCMVFVLLVLIFVEAKLSGRGEPSL